MNKRRTEKGIKDLNLRMHQAFPASGSRVSHLDNNPRVPPQDQHPQEVNPDEEQSVNNYAPNAPTITNSIPFQG